MERATSFGRAVDAYDSARPSYPAEAVSWLVPAGATRVVDLGAGTGKFTSLLVDARRSVIAVEPSPAMLARLHETLPTVDARAGSAEAIPVEDGWADALTCAQAWHWVDPEKGLPEVARVLRPGGMFSLVWNSLDGAVPWAVELGSAAGGRVGGGFEKLTDAGELFGPVETAVFAWVYELDRAGIHSLVASWSQYITASPAARALMLARVDGVLDARGGDRFALPYKAHCFRTRRA